MKNGSALVCTAFVVLALEIVGRLFVPATWSPQIFRSTPEPPGFALIGGYTSHYRRRRLHVDPRGRRVVVPRSLRGRVVHVIGNEQVFGLSLDDEFTIPSRLQADLGPAYRVIDDGVPGYGPYAYRSKALSLSREDVAIVVLSDADDLRAYSAVSSGGAHCGYLIDRSAWSYRLPCPLLTSGVARGIAYLRWLDARNAAAVPLDYDPGATFAARVLGARVRRLLEATRRRAAARLIVACVPWDGALEASHLAHYRPRLRNVAATVGCTDDAGVGRALRDAGGERFADDGTLSALGADLVARALARAVRGSRAPVGTASRRRALFPRMRHRRITHLGDRTRVYLRRKGCRFGRTSAWSSCGFASVFGR